MTRLSNTIFQGRSTDAMVAVDAYEISKSTPKNGIYDTVKGIYTDAIVRLNTDKNAAHRLTQLILRSKSNQVDKFGLINDALGVLGSSLPNVLGQLGGAMQKRIADTAGMLMGDNAKRAVEVIYNDAGRLITAASVKDARELLEFVGEITDAELIKFIDIEAESAVLASIARELVAYNVPEMLDDLIAAASTEEIKDNIYSYIGATAISGSDLVTVNKIIDRIGLTGFLEYNPDAINQILTSFTIGSDTTVEQYPDKRTLLINTLVRIDPNWDKVLRAGVYLPNLGRYIAANREAKLILSLEEPERTLCMTAGTYAPLTVHNVIKDLYPDAYVS